MAYNIPGWIRNNPKINGQCQNMWNVVVWMPSLKSFGWVFLVPGSVLLKSLSLVLLEPDSVLLKSLRPVFLEPGSHTFILTRVYRMFLINGYEFLFLSDHIHLLILFYRQLKMEEEINFIKTWNNKCYQCGVYDAILQLFEISRLHVQNVFVKIMQFMH